MSQRDQGADRFGVFGFDSRTRSKQARLHEVSLLPLLPYEGFESYGFGVSTLFGPNFQNLASEVVENKYDLD